VRSRGYATLAVVLACLLGAGVYVGLAVDTDQRAAAKLAPQSAAVPDARTEPLSPRLELAVRAVDPRDPRLGGAVTVVDPSHPRRRSDHGLECERIALGGGRGLCLYLARSGVDYRASILDSRFHVRHRLSLEGVPSRARVSPDGRYGATTTFTTGDSYTEAGGFSTRTNLLDMATGHIIADLESFTVVQDGHTLHAPDFNFWGVSFTRADSDRFYATLGTGTHHYLVRGSVRGRRLEILRDAVECPAVSPDGRRIAYKRPLGGGRWRLAVLDLATLRSHDLAETRSIDDQSEWLDPRHIGYSDGHDVWAVDADGSGQPVRLVRGAQSPISVRY
jgi:hypothetical protein